MFQEKIDILFTPRPSPLATSALGKLYLRKTRIWCFVWAKESMETYPACHGFRFFKFLSPLVAPSAGRRIPPPARKTSGTQGKRNKLYLLNRLSHGRQAGIRGVTWLSIVLFTVLSVSWKATVQIVTFSLKPGTSYSLSTRDKLKKRIIQRY